MSKIVSNWIHCFSLIFCKWSKKCPQIPPCKSREDYVEFSLPFDTHTNDLSLFTKTLTLRTLKPLPSSVGLLPWDHTWKIPENVNYFNLLFKNLVNCILARYLRCRKRISLDSIQATRVYIILSNLFFRLSAKSELTWSHITDRGGSHESRYIREHNKKFWPLRYSSSRPP